MAQDVDVFHLSSSDPSFEDSFGRSVAIHGNRAIVGAIEVDKDEQTEDSGAAYIFEWNGVEWVEMQKLTSSDGTADDWFGIAVAIDENRAVVGAISRNDGDTVLLGAVYVFDWDGTNWVETAILAQSDADLGGFFARALSLQGDRIAVSAINVPNPGVTSTGAVYIYEWDGTQWNEEEKLFAVNGSASEAFGTAVALQDDRLLVGANTYGTGLNEDQGAVYVFENDGTSWNETALLTASDGEWYEGFGNEVALHGDRALIAASGDEIDGATNQGSAYLFEWDGSTWNEIAQLTRSNGQQWDYFGRAVALNDNIALVGSGSVDITSFSDAGSVTVFEFDGTEWVETMELTETNPDYNNEFGTSIAADGNRFIIGTRYADIQLEDGTTVQDAGAAYMYDFALNPLGVLAADPLDVDFGFIELGASSAPASITLTNTGAAPLDVTSLAFTGDHPASFTHSFTAPFTIPEGGSSVIDVTFIPQQLVSAVDAETVLYRINAGGNAIDQWSEDTDGMPSPYLLPGSTNIETTGDEITTNESVPAGTPIDLFTSKRLDANQNAPAMEWDFPVEAGGEYEVRLYFVEMSRCNVGNRLFDVEIEGEVVLDNFDIYAEAGNACEVGIMRSHILIAEDETLDINFPLANGKPSAVAGFEIITLATPTTIQSAQLTIEHTGANWPVTVDLAGETGNTPAASTVSASSDVITFGLTEEGMVSESVTLTLSNEGSSPIDITSVGLAGADEDDFTHTFTAPVTLSGGSTSIINVAFAPQPVSAAATTPLEGESILFRVNAGGSLVDNWEEDTADEPSLYLLAGSSGIETDGPTPTLDATVPAGTPLDLFTHKRIDANKPEPYMEWDFPVEAGSELVVNLFFVEMSRCSVGARVFDVTIDGAIVLDDFDVYAEAGSACNQGTMRSLTVIATDDNLDIDFPLVNGKPAVVAAIEVLRSGTTIDVDTRVADLLIEHTGSNPALSIALSGEAIPSSDTTDTGGNPGPVAAFTYEYAPADPTGNNAFLVDVSTDSDGEIVARQWDVGGVGAAEESVSIFQDPDTPFTVTLTVTDDGGKTSSVSESITLSEITLTEIDGMVVFDAENYVTNDPFESHSWVNVTSVEGFSGAAAMQAQPNDGTTSNGINSAHMSYEANFTSGGTYYLWARVYAETISDNSLHLGDNGSATAVKANQNTVGEWSWTNVNTKNNTLTVDLSSDGMNTIDVWMREDGLILDKLVVTTDDLFVAEGLGPDESQRKGIAVASSAPEVQLAGKAGEMDGLSKIESTQEALPESFVLQSNYPNPFNQVTAIEFELPERAAVRLDVFDMMGRRVATLVDQQMAAGRHQTRWDALSDAGAPVASGVYIYRIHAGSFQAVQQMILMK